MPEPRAPQDLLQPALLDRLTDEDSGTRIEPREARVMNKRELRAAVLRDLAWLLNTARLERKDELGSVPYARRSVINYGLPALSGRTASSIEITDLERGIREAIIEFEPRILADSLRVRAVEVADHNQHNVIGIQISGQLWAEPVPMELLVRTEIDLETGHVALADLNAGRAV